MEKKSNTLTDKIREIADQWPDRVVMQTKKQDSYLTYTYKDFYSTSQKVAYFLISLGIRKGDRVAIVLENRPEWGMIHFGILMAAAIAIPLDPQSNVDEIEYFLSDSEGKAVFTSAKLVTQFTGSAGNLHSLKNIIALDIEKPPRGITSFSQAISGSPDSRPSASLPDISPQDTASILYTSGTTARAKGVVLTHNNFCANFQSIDKLGLFSDRDHFLSILPLHHSFPFMATLIVPLFCRSRITYISSLKSDDVLGTMREAGITVLVCVPQLMNLFYSSILTKIKEAPLLIRSPIFGIIETLWPVRKITGANFTKPILSKIHRAFGEKLRFFVCGGAKLNEDAARFLVKIGFTILEGYGLTETSPAVTFNTLKRQIFGSVGKVIPDVELRIDDPDEQGVGEVAIKGPNVMKGYYKRDEETREVIKEGWFYSGDLGYIDKEGFLYLTGRKKELIVLSSGKNISPVEVESYYSQSPFIKSICVLAIGEKEEEKLVAVIVPDTDYFRKVGEVNIYDRIKWVLENLSKQYPPYKRIMGFIITDKDLPRTRLGKLKRFEIKEMYLYGFKGLASREKEDKAPLGEADLEIFSSQAAKKIVDILSKQVNFTRQIGLDDHLEIDVGLDSLNRVELMSAVEKIFKINIPESTASKIFTVRELILEVEKAYLSAEPQTGAVAPTDDSISLWNGILNTDPAKEITEKIDLFPGWASKIFCIFVSGTLRIIFRLFWRLKVQGLQNLPSQGAFIICPNHGGYLDAFLIMSSLPRRLKYRMFFLGLRAYFEVSMVRYIVKLIRVIPIDPGARLVDAMQACAYVLRNGKAACLFPEGARSIDGEVKEFKKGVGILAKELDIKLIPAYIKGSYDAWPRTRRLPRLRPITVVFGQPKTIEELSEVGLRLGAKDNYEAIAFGVREEVVKLQFGLTQD